MGREQLDDDWEGGESDCRMIGGGGGVVDEQLGLRVIR